VASGRSSGSMGEVVAQLGEVVVSRRSSSSVGEVVVSRRSSGSRGEVVVSWEKWWHSGSDTRLLTSSPGFESGNLSKLQWTPSP
jgi:hypothetical protein